MFRTWREARNEEGFTLIELLVVVIIIGILAAIAIPAFLNQRERAWQSEVTSAVRNASLDIEAEATANVGVYPLTADGQDLAVAWIDANVNSEAYGTADATPINNIVYEEFRAAAGDPVTGFSLCMEHTLISEAHSVTYLGGAAGNGVQGFVRGTGC